MENAGASITDNEGYRQILKGHGIGTQATRAEIIKKLFDVKYVRTEQKGKVNYIVPTKKGYSATRVFPTELLSPTMTADWETKIAKVADGTYSENQFMNEFESFMKSTISKYKYITVDGLDFSDKEELGKCLWCGSPVVYGSFKNKDTGKKRESYYCTNKECRFSLFKEDKFFSKRTKKNLSASHVKTLLKDGSVTVACINVNDVKYNTKFTIVKQESGYAGWNVEFVDSKKKSGKKPLKKW
jgi:DNA topoisomerase-3